MIIHYSGIRLEVTNVVEFVRQPVLSDDGVDYLFTEFELHVIALVSSDQIVKALQRNFNNDTIGMSYKSALTGELRAGAGELKIAKPANLKKTPDSNPIITDKAIRHWLSVPRRRLTISDELEKEFLLISPKVGFAVDAHNGPVPTVYAVEQVYGDARSFVVSLRIKTWVNECEENTGLVGALLSNRFGQRHDIDEDGYITITTKGEARFRTDYVSGVLNPDELRPFLFLPIPNGFKRQAIVVEGGSDGSVISYEFVDQQMHQQLVVGDEIGATRVEGTYTQALVLDEDSGDAALELQYKTAEHAASVTYANTAQIPFAIGFAATKTAIQGLITARNTMPKNVEHMRVTVWGGPKAKRRDLYRLAMALIWGQIQRRENMKLFPPASRLIMSYDIHLKNVTVECQVITNWLDIIAAPNVAKNRPYEIFSGPKESMVGGEWAFTTNVPFANVAGIDFKNDFDGRTLITSNAVFKGKAGTQVSRSPTPPGDRLSRGLATIANSETVKSLDKGNWNNRPDHLLWAALSAPCSPANYFKPTYTPPAPTYTPIPSPNATPYVTPMYSTGIPVDSPFLPPDQLTIDQTTPTSPPQRTLTDTLTVTQYVVNNDPAPPTNPAGTPQPSDSPNYNPDGEE